MSIDASVKLLWGVALIMRRVCRAGALLALSGASMFAVSVNPLPGGSPNDFNTGAGAFTGVAAITMDGFGSCSGSLLYSGMHILTAAHCLDQSAGNPSSVHATFIYDGGSLTVDGAGIYVPSEWTGSIEGGWDWALLVLAMPINDPLIDRYMLATDPAEDWGVVTIAGYGVGGTGDTGQNRTLYPYGTRRAGQNETEGYWTGLGRNGSATLVYDFDGAGINSLGSAGLGPGQEVMVTSGDSGGPSFRNGVIVGVHSFVSLLNEGDNIGLYGQFGTDTRVSWYADLIRAEVDLAPEPGSLALMGFGVIVLLCRRRRSRRS